MRLVLGRSLLLAALLICGGAGAQDSLRIAAVVNDDIISAYDLNARLSLALASSKVSNEAEARRRLAPQVLRTLIDDKLKIQEARRLSIRASKKDIDRALGRIERQNKLPRGGLGPYLAKNGIDMVVLIDQIEAEIVWSKAVNRRLRIQIQVGEDEIDEMLAQIEANKGKPEHRVVEIFLPVDEREDEQKTRLLAERLVQQLEAGASFRTLARNFSQSASAAVGGDLGWIKQGQLATEVDAALVKMRPGQMSKPIKTEDGYYVLLLIDRRADPGLDTGEVTVSLNQLFLPLPPKAGQAVVDRQMERARTLAQQARSCADMERLGKKTGSPLSGSLGKIKVSKLPGVLKAVVKGLADRTASRPIRKDDGIIVLMICEREQEGSDISARQKVAGMLMDQRLNIAARRYLRDLRRAAFVDVRM